VPLSSPGLPAAAIATMGGYRAIGLSGRCDLRGYLPQPIEECGIVRAAIQPVSWSRGSAGSWSRWSIVASVVETPLAAIRPSAHEKSRWLMAGGCPG
jgi:hypothetical protein